MSEFGVVFVGVGVGVVFRAVVVVVVVLRMLSTNGQSRLATRLRRVR